MKKKLMLDLKKAFWKKNKNFFKYSKASVNNEFNLLNR